MPAGTRTTPGQGTASGARLWWLLLYPMSARGHPHHLLQPSFLWGPFLSASMAKEVPLLSIPSARSFCCLCRWRLCSAACPHSTCHPGGEADTHQAAGSPWSHHPGAEHHPEGSLAAQGRGPGSGCLPSPGVWVTFSPGCPGLEEPGPRVLGR